MPGEVAQHIWRQLMREELALHLLAMLMSISNFGDNDGRSRPAHLAASIILAAYYPGIKISRV